MTNETIKTVSSPEMLEAAERRFNEAGIQLKDAINNPQNRKAYLKAVLEEENARGDLIAIRNTQFANQFTEHNEAKGITQ